MMTKVFVLCANSKSKLSHKKRLLNSYDYNEYTALKCSSETILRLEFYSQNHYNWHGEKYGLDYFWIIFGPFYRGNVHH